MSFKILLLSLVVVAEIFYVNAAISPATMFIKLRAEEALQQQIFKAKSDISSCHDHYSNALKTLLDKYNEDIKQCEDSESQKLLELSTEGQEDRDTTTKSLNEVCESLSSCEDEEENLKFFECVNSSGDQSTRVLWKASRDSSDSAADIKEQIHAIKFETSKCTSDAERVYVVETTKATEEMVDCYKNGGMPEEPEN